MDGSYDSWESASMYLIKSVDTLHTKMDTHNTAMHDLDTKISTCIADLEGKIDGIEGALVAHIDNNNSDVTASRFNVSTGTQWVAIAVAVIFGVVACIIAL